MKTGNRKLAAALAGGFLYILAMALLLQTSYDVAGGVVVAHVLAIPSVIIIRRITKHETDHRITTILMAALGLKLLGTLARYAVAFEVYGGTADAAKYDESGRAIAAAFRNFDFAIDLGHRVVGTGFMEIFTGVVYVFTGPTKFGGFVVYSWLGFLGLLLFYRAFRIAVPEGDAFRYAALLMLFPSLLFWPSSIGKESWMMLTIGATAYGIARLMAKGRTSFVWLGAGVLGTVIVRPHIAITLMAGLLVAFLFTLKGGTSFSAPLAKLANLLVLGVILVFVGASVQNYFHLDEISENSVDKVLQLTEEQTSQGGSGFEAVGARSPAQLPGAIVGVLFRPFPFEATNPQSLLASLEGVAMFVLLVRSRSRLRGVFRNRHLYPYLIFAATYSVLFILAFSNVGNFGILARQRVQLFPFLFALLAAPLPSLAQIPSYLGRRPLPAASRSLATAFQGSKP